MPLQAASTPEPTGPRGISRRRFVGYLVAGATLTVAADLRLGTPAEAAIPSPPQIAALFDLEDLETTAALATSGAHHGHDQP